MGELFVGRLVRTHTNRLLGYAKNPLTLLSLLLNYDGTMECRKSEMLNEWHIPVAF